jgi:chemotaxis protein MotB
VSRFEEPGPVPDPQDTVDRESLDGRFADQGVVGMTTDWSVPWSDLMMVLFILFVVLYCYEATERTVHEAFREDPLFPEHTASTPLLREPSFEPAPAGSVFEQSRDWVQKAQLEDVDVVLQSDQTVRVNVHGPTYFDLGKAELRPETRRFLRGLAAILAANPYEIHVVGHTDTFPIHSERFPTNWELSAARAARVARYLIEQGRLEPGRFTLMGHSMYRPAVPNSSLENKALNRRVEIIITRQIFRGGGEG